MCRCCKSLGNAALQYVSKPVVQLGIAAFRFLPHRPLYTRPLRFRGARVIDHQGNTAYSFTVISRGIASVVIVVSSAMMHLLYCSVIVVRSDNVEMEEIPTQYTYEHKKRFGGKIYSAVQLYNMYMTMRCPMPLSTITNLTLAILMHHLKMKKRTVSYT